MLIILLLFALIRTLRSVPLSLPLANGLPALDLRDAPSHFGERTVSDIIVSCFATIFACTWTAVHPNIPGPTDCAWTRFKRQFVTMVYALLAPEAITAWALRQRLAAGEIMADYNRTIATYQSPEASYSILGALFHDCSLPPKLKDGQVPQWTLAHAFFLQMGGFMLSEGGQPIQTLATFGSHFEDTTDMGWYIKYKFIDPPPTTEEEITDRSKGDAISKTLIILQTTWFIAQCIARWSNRLPVTELEVVTLGFAMLNGITYGLWWHKPQNVGRPIFFEIKHKKSSRGVQANFSGTKVSRPRDATKPKHSETGKQESSRAQRAPNRSRGLFKTQEEEAAFLVKNFVFRRKLHSQLRQDLQRDLERYACSAPWKLVYLIPLRFVEGLLRPLVKLAEYHRFEVKYGDLRVPMFYVSWARTFDSKVYGPTAIIGILFGSVHLITSWFLDFASTQEMWLWRISAILITVGPAFLGIWEYSTRMDSKLWELRDIFRSILIGMLPFYIISRIVILALALASLRALPLAALQTINWTTFIPHI